ncbi:MAG: NAD-dependent epimerase/dehydratase family protein [Actinobacteria bacterium]|nr:NAD-dependent epimerase/dehydratase family protein [Actinomycetota bacterium]
MRVVITGATGNVGTSLIDVLGHEDQVTSIVGLARRPPAWQPAKTRWGRADVTKDDLSTYFDAADVVVHLSWIFQPTRDPLATWRTNVLGSIRVFEAVSEATVPALVYASSVGSYSPGPQHDRVDESWPTHALPTAAYGREKSYVERLLDTFERDHPETRVVRLRPGFIFKRESAAEQRRLFVGPLLPNRLARPDLIPIVPDLPGLRLQALHTRDAAEAYRLAIVRDVRGPFNIAAEPVLDPPALAELFDARPVKMPVGALRAAMSAAWRLHLIPASPMLFDLALSLPVMDTTRARTELGWEPSRTSQEAIREMMEGLREGAGMDTPPLHPKSGGKLRQREIATGIGERARARPDVGR